MNLECNSCNFADDTTLFSCRPSIDIVITEVEDLTNNPHLVRPGRDDCRPYKISNDVSREKSRY